VPRYVREGGRYVSGSVVHAVQCSRRSDPRTWHDETASFNFKPLLRQQHRHSTNIANMVSSLVPPKVRAFHTGVVLLLTHCAQIASPNVSPSRLRSPSAATVRHRQCQLRIRRTATILWNTKKRYRKRIWTDSALLRPSAAPPTQLACSEWSASTRSFRVVRHRSQRRGVSWSGTA